MRRGRVGKRKHNATSYVHNGNQDAAGNPTYTIDGDWLPVVSHWPCEMLATRGGESLRGKQVDAETTNVLFGEYSGGLGITPDQRVKIADVTYNVVSAYDSDGMGMELRVELKREV